VEIDFFLFLLLSFKKKFVAEFEQGFSCQNPKTQAVSMPA